MLDMKLQEALKARAQKNAESGSKFKTFNAVMMKFATVESGFEKARAVFHEKDRDGNGSIDLDEFMAASNELSFSLSDDMKRSIFEESDFDGNRQIDFKEFVVMLALIHLLESTSGKSEYFNKDENVALGNAIDLATDAFLFFDIDGSGFISKDEVLQQMDDSTPAAKNQHRGSISRDGTDGSPGAPVMNPLGDGPSPAHSQRSSLKRANNAPSNRSLTQQRFAEMDWDTNGRVSFKEFLFAFEGWVGLDEDEE